MINIVSEIPTAPFSPKNALLYARVKDGGREWEEKIVSAYEEILPLISYKACYRELEIKPSCDTVDFGEFTAKSKSLASRLSGCARAVIFAATLGVEIDRLIKKYSRKEPSRAILISAAATERIEAFCDALDGVLKEKYGEIRDRFSPGYGDLDLSVQGEIFLSLSPEKNAGIYLNDSFIMTPSKSVSAIVGIG